MYTSYEAKGGGTVCIPKTLDPYKQLGISTSTTFQDTKKALRKEITRPSRQTRAIASLAYHMITSTSRERYTKCNTLFEIRNPDIYMFAAIGHTNKVLAEISKDPKLLNSVDERSRPVLYLTARSGFYDTTEALLKKGANANQKQSDDSTPLHAAAFYGQNLVVKLLLSRGADPSLKNKHGNTPADESTEEIKKIFENFKKDPVSIIAGILSVHNSVETEVNPIRYKGKIIAREVIRSKKLLEFQTNHQWREIRGSWEPAFHGTKYDFIESIMRNGLLPSGAKLPNGKMIQPPKNHYQLEKRYCGVDNWANAIFVSPSILYASHACYSERVVAGDSQFCVVMKVLVKPSSYKSYNPTVIFDKDPIDGEPENPEYRVTDKNVEDAIFRVLSRVYLAAGGRYRDRTSIEDTAEASRNVVVESVLFIDVDFLENIEEKQISYEDICKLFK